MNIIVCLDDKNGMLFNKRRQSSDRILYQRILDITKDSRLFMNSYSAKQFQNSDSNVTVREDFLNVANTDDFCFVENSDITEFICKIKMIIIYRWNRNYPSDIKFPISAFIDRWSQVSSTDFAGGSHERITEEIYAL